VDDNEIDNIISHAIIKKMDIADETVKANNGQEALDYIIQNCNSGLPDFLNLIFLDINMPGMDGFQFLEEFNKLEKKEKFFVVMLSSSRDRKDLERSLTLNASHYLEKPLTREKIDLIIKKFNI
jgi:CheY-like chemotaxis protein